jgi:4'-phosphopantetheinyl transferase
MLMLPDRDIQIWSTHLDLVGVASACAEASLKENRAQIDKFSQFLTTAERQRAAKFVNPLHGDRWIVARGYLRQILSQYLDLSPAQIVFTVGAQGKPAVEGARLQFNLSHSGDRAVYAISAQDPVGIDIESIHPIAAADLVDRFFSATEQAIFHSLPIDLQQAAFFHAWVQKEAYLKACGTGLHTPLDKIEVSIDPRTPAAIISAPLEGIWRIQKLEISPDYASAIVVGGDYDEIRYLTDLLDRPSDRSVGSINLRP